MDYEKRLQELFVELPEVAEEEGVESSLQVGELLFVGQQLPYTSGKLAFKGRLGLEVTLDQGKLAARYALLSALSVLRKALGSLNKVQKIIQLNGTVASGGSFQEQDRVFDSALGLLKDIFGPNGKPTRIAVGVGNLPKNASVALSLIVAAK